jgi:hypothetical protein
MMMLLLLYLYYMSTGSKAGRKQEKRNNESDKVKYRSRIDASSTRVKILSFVLINVCNSFFF